MLLAVVGSAVGCSCCSPFTWSGGGGPPGNRYFMSVYPALFFLTPADISIAAGVLAWIGGALFTAKMLVNPFFAAKFPQVLAERGLVRRLPVELTMANDLPIMLDATRAHIWFSDVLLYFLDEHAYTPETIDPAGHHGIWIAGDGRADILMRCEWPIDQLRMTAESPIRTTFTVSAGGVSVACRARARNAGDASTCRPSGVRGLNSYAYLLSAQSTDGFTRPCTTRRPPTTGTSAC